MRSERFYLLGACVAAVLVVTGCGSGDGPVVGGAAVSRRSGATGEELSPNAAGVAGAAGGGAQAGAQAAPSEPAAGAGVKWSATADPGPGAATVPVIPNRPFSIPYGDVVIPPGGAGRVAVAEEGGGTWQTFDLVSGEKLGGITSKTPSAKSRALSHDGLTLAVDSILDRQSLAQIWSLRDNALLREFEVAPGESLVSLDFLPDGQLVSMNEAPWGPRIAVWDVGSGRMVREWTIPSPQINNMIHSRIAVSPGGRYLAVLFKPATLHLYDIQRGASVGRIDLELAGVPAFSPQSYLRFRPDGRQLALCLSWINTEDRLYCWDLATGRKELEQTWTQVELLGYEDKQGRRQLESPFDWLPDGSAWLIRGRFLVDSRTGERLGAFSTEDAVAYVPLTRQSVLAVKRPGQKQSQRVTVQSDLVASGSAEAARVAGLSRNQAPAASMVGPVIGGVGPPVARTPPEPRPVKPMPVDKAEIEERLARGRAGEPDLALRLRAAQQQAAERELAEAQAAAGAAGAPMTPGREATADPSGKAPRGGGAAGAAVVPGSRSPNRERTESVTWQVQVDPAAEPIEVFSAPKIRVKVPAPLRVEFPHVASNYAVLRRDGDVLSTVDLRTGVVVGTHEGRWLAPENSAVSPDGQQVSYFYPYPTPNSIQVWSLARNKAVALLPLPSEGRPQRIVYAGNRWLVGIHTEASGYSFICWDVELQQIVAAKRLPGATGDEPSQPVALSPGGRYLAVLNVAGLYILELPQFQLVGYASLHNLAESNELRRSESSRVAFSTDGTRIAATYTSYQRDTLLIWETATGKELLNRHFQWMFDGRAGGLTRSKEPLVWFPDNRCLLYQRRLVIDAMTGAPIWMTKQHPLGDCLPLGSNRLALLESTAEQDLEIRDVAFPKLFANALEVARRTPSERTPKLTEGDWSSARNVEPRVDAVAWNVVPDRVALAPGRFADSFPLGKTEELVIPSVIVAPPAAATMVTQRAANPISIVSTTGPMRPERSNLFETWNLLTGQRLKTQQLPGGSTVIDISPDGSLVLTGDTRWVPYEPQFLGTSYFDRLDVWAPQLDRHAVGWRPMQSSVRDTLEVAQWAKFVDKRHVLVGSSREVTLWKLPECQVEYVLRDAGQLGTLSANRKYFLMSHEKRGLEIYESLTGEKVGQLTWPYRLPDSNLACARFHPQGERLVALLGSTLSGQVAEWDMKTGELTRQFGVPLAYSGRQQLNLEWLGDQHLMVCAGVHKGKTHLIDLQRRAVVAEVRILTGISARGQYDDTHWFQHQTVSAANERHNYVSRKKFFDELDESKLPTFESVAMLYPGMKVRFSNKLHLGGMDDTITAVREALAKSYISFDDSSPYRFELESRVTPVAATGVAAAKIRAPLTPNYELFMQWAIYDEAGNLRFRQRRNMKCFRAIAASDAEWDQRIRFDLHQYFSDFQFPLYVYREGALSSLRVLEY